ncbi:30S ribosomal protein S17 [Oleiphilus sp. HI0132]
MGDVVTIQETRPLSKTKSFTLLNIDEKASNV